MRAFRLFVQWIQEAVSITVLITERKSEVISQEIMLINAAEFRFDLHLTLIWVMVIFYHIKIVPEQTRNIVNSTNI